MDNAGQVTYNVLMECVRSQREPEFELSVDECRDLIDEAYDRWCDSDVGIDTLVAWMEAKFNVDINSDALQFSDLEAAYKLHSHTMIGIHRLSCNSGLIPKETEQNSGGLAKEKINKAFTICREMYSALRANAIALHKLDEMREQQVLTLPDLIGTESFIDHDKSKNSSFQNLVSHVLTLLNTAKYRRHGDKCYKEIYTNVGYRTHAWEPYKKGIEEHAEEESLIINFIGENVTKETDYTNWKHLSNPHDNGPKVVEYLMRYKHMEFPALKINRYLFAFENGLYNMKDDMFYPFQMIQETDACQGLFWHKIDTLDDSHVVIENEKLKQALRQKIEAHQPLEFTIGEVENFELEELDFCNVIKVNDGEYFSSDGNTIVDMEAAWPQMAADITDFRLKAGWKGYKAEPPSQLDVAVKFFNQPFRFSITPEEETAFDPHAISLPEIELLFDTQFLEQDTQAWVLIFLARLFYPVKFLDKWEVILFIEGVAGSGKSTLAKLIRYCFPPELLTTLSANMEQKFGLSGVYKGLICICSEVREDFGLDQGDWQAAASGEEVQIAVKNKTPFQHKWNTPMFLLGNVQPKYADTQGSVARRMLLIKFNKKVSSSDPHLFDKVVSNIDLFLRKANVLYHEAVRLHGHRDVWDVRYNMLPKQIMDFHKEQMIATNSLLAFLESGLFTFGTLSFMDFNHFKEMYYDFCKSNNQPKPRWTTSHYQLDFDEKGLSIGTEEKIIAGQKVNTKWLYGISAETATES